jgi:hypothetical protein
MNVYRITWAVWDYDQYFAGNWRLNIGGTKLVKAETAQKAVAVLRTAIRHVLEVTTCEYVCKVDFE